ncbi:MAG: hypothetical protein ACFFB5_06540 [Promethearchaeota archaeon]
MDIFKIPKPCKTADAIHSVGTNLENINLLNFSGLWKINNEECYSKWFLEEVQKLRIIVIEFIQEGYSQSVCDKYDQDFQLIRELAFNVLEFTNITSALFRVNGWKGRLGLELAKARLRLFKKEKGRNPVQRDKGFNGLQKALRRKLYWEKYVITSWNELLRAAFGDVNQEYGTYNGKEGLEVVEEKLRNFHREFDRIPTTRDNGMSQYLNIISRGIWKDFNIKSWNDLLKTIFGEVNKENNVYTGQAGFEKAKMEALEFYSTHERKPKANDCKMMGICTAIKRKYWEDQKIHSWNDFLFHIFGEVNKKSHIWTGEEGLEYAKAYLRMYYKTNEIKPTRRSKGVGGIVKAIQRGYWTKNGINSWIDLLKEVWNE